MSLTMFIEERRIYINLQLTLKGIFYFLIL